MMTARLARMGTCSQALTAIFTPDEHQDQRHPRLQVHELVQHPRQHEEERPSPRIAKTLEL